MQSAAAPKDTASLLPPYDLLSLLIRRVTTQILRHSCELLFQDLWASLCSLQEPCTSLALFFTSIRFFWLLYYLYFIGYLQAGALGKWMDGGCVWDVSTKSSSPQHSSSSLDSRLGSASCSERSHHRTKSKSLNNELKETLHHTMCSCCKKALNQALPWFCKQ